MSQAKKAAEEAKNFKGFDEMAEEDDYIHSEGLNVKNSAPAPPPPPPGPQEDSVSVEPTWSLLDRPRGRPVSRNASSISSASPVASLSPVRVPTTVKAPALPKPQPQPAVPKSPYLSVVADALETGSATRNEDPRTFKSSSFSGYDSDNEESAHRQQQRRYSSSSTSSSSSSSSSSDDDSSASEDDVILTQIRNKQKKKQLKKKKKKKKKAKRKQRKKSNRFMEDLESRMPAPVPGSAASAAEFAQQQQQQQRAALEVESQTTTAKPSKGRLTSFKSWMADSWSKGVPDNAASPIATTAAGIADKFLKLGPLSRKEAPPQAPATVQEEEFLITNSSSVMSPDELAALAAMNSSSQQSMFSPASLYAKMKKSPRESFVAFTMLFAIWAYFWTRKTSNENDVQ